MYQNLKKLSERYKNIVAIVGNAHVEGISNLLKKDNIDFKDITVKDYIELPITLKSLDGLGLVANITRCMISFLLILIFLLIFFRGIFFNDSFIGYIQFIIIFLFWGFFMLNILFERIDKWREKKLFN
jgi:pheromone shutdown protein TraB